MTFEIENLVFHNLNPVSLHLPESFCIGLFGSSGAGKTLFLRALADLDPHGGSVSLDEKPANDYKPHDWRKKVGLLPSESQWWFDTVGEHFHDCDGDALGRLGFDNDVMRWQVSRLSSGEKQRLGLLRLLANLPAVLLLDEPTANLDPRFVGEVEAILDRYKKQRPASLIWVSHDRGQLERVADRIFEIRDQHLLEVNRG
ncbi:ATP-binding cassette domain-containing protein [candidate division KSB1 bacterium]|nr:ATP-binding cassette domain-containing protein [candidate division KSB1 bacterium]